MRVTNVSAYSVPSGLPFSVEQLIEIGCQWVILGHSELRHVTGEYDQLVGKKAAYALGQNLKVMACIGELLEETEAWKTFDVCFKQLSTFAGLYGLLEPEKLLLLSKLRKFMPLCVIG
ncbi:triosephosphate isomerase, chloroplastic-like [Lolium perenne]|uniref:triosephosphate isomerase, chloroplastic-like n=1 Tax=Lolium perenne TaxID=4522 RepID=UPI0021F559E7|nr:triosephosphate isomerase, chloroplastic-like [Lolium perenne]